MTTTNSLFPHPSGALAYELSLPAASSDTTTTGDLVLCIPGVGDLRSEYRLLREHLLAAGHAVAVVDLPGHGESPVPPTPPSRVDVGTAVGELATRLAAQTGRQVHLVGCSLGASASAVAAANHGDAIASLTLIGPFLRDHDGGISGRLQRLALWLGMLRPWGPTVWASFRRRLFPLQAPEGLDTDHEALVANLRQPGRMSTMRAMSLSSCADVEPLLSVVRSPTLVVMGTADPDFPDPQAEARWAAEATAGQAVMVEGAGHYPHLEVPTDTAQAILAHLSTAPAAAR